ncbi:MAG: hypothetical protein MUO76_13720 [Anaerolineaceae bacterium]|nr:hypothetical protein [Anaerolineaceae bacterium]
MSGHKRTTITINEAEYRRLHEAEIRKRFVEKELPKITRELKRDTQKILQDNLSEAEHRHEEFQYLLENLDEQIRTVEKEPDQAMVEQQAEMIEMLQGYAGELWDHSEELLTKQREDLFLQLQMDHQHKQEQILNMEERFEEIENDHERKISIAENWISASQHLIGFIETNYNLGKFNSARTEYAQRQLQTALENMSLNIPEAAIVCGQQAYWELSDLRIELEKQQADWNILYHTVLEKVKEIFFIAERNREIPATDLQGNELENLINVDHWSGGELSRLIEYTGDLIEQLETGVEFLDFNILENLINEIIPELSGDLEDIITRARMDVISSQMRINIADLVIGALSEQGFVPENSGYSKADMRASFYASVRNLEGSEIVIQVEPIEGIGNRNELHLHSLDREGKTHHELRQRSKEISRSLQKYGLQVGAMSTQPDVNKDFMAEFLPVEIARTSQRN